MILTHTQTNKQKLTHIKGQYGLEEVFYMDNSQFNMWSFLYFSNFKKIQNAFFFKDLSSNTTKKYDAL